MAAFVSVGTADGGATLDAAGLDLGGHDGGTSARGSALLEVATSLTAIGTGDIGSASMGVAEGIAARSCRITTPVFRIVAQRPAARGAGGQFYAIDYPSMPARVDVKETRLVYYTSDYTEIDGTNVNYAWAEAHLNVAGVAAGLVGPVTAKLCGLAIWDQRQRPSNRRPAVRV